jgi:sterol desaturase/sphingolipid hydroxylase (fatty acid hydroxylase superfamily)
VGGWILDQETAESIAATVTAIVAGYVLIELALLGLWKRRLDLRVVRMTLLGIGSVIVAGVTLGLLVGPVSLVIAALAGSRLAIFEVDHGALSWVYGFFVYEFFYWVQHWLAHKVRLLWCLHSPHHAPRGIHMAIGANHHFLESLLYFPLFLGFLPALAGVDPIVVIAMNALDVLWGSFLHVSDATITSGRYGALGLFLQTPAYHRVHHAKNPRYMDRNYNSITLFWDWVMGTLEPLDDAEPVAFGITRPVDDGSFWDVHFGEFRALAGDIRGAGRLADAIGYVLRPPGWQPGDTSRTASAQRTAWLERRHEPAGAGP